MCVCVLRDDVCWFIWFGKEAFKKKCVRALVCDNRVWNVSKGVQGSPGVHGEYLSFSLSPSHPSCTHSTSGFCMVARGERNYPNVTVVPSHLWGAQVQEWGDGCKKGVLRDSWLSARISLAFYFKGCQIYLPAVSFMFCFFTICTVQGDHKLHLGAYIKNGRRSATYFPSFLESWAQTQKKSR